MKTFYSNLPRDGHRAETEIDLGNRHVLTISTRKDTNRILVSRASVCEVQGNIKKHGFNGNGDFRKTVLKTTPKRVTANVVREQHGQALARIEEIKLAVELHYEAQAKTAAHA